MANFVKCKARMVRSHDVDSKKKLEDLGIEVDDEIEEVFNPICVDFDSIITYLNHYNRDGVEVSGYSEITMVHGGYMIIDIDFQKLDKMLRGVEMVGGRRLKESKLPD